MPRLCILTPDPDDESFHSRWREVFARMAEPLQAAGATVEGRAWTTDEDLSGFDLILPLMVWGNYRAVDRWLERVADWQRQGLPIQNPPSVLSWNVDKIYLDRLRQGGAPTPPTVWVERGDAEAVRRAREQIGWTDVVLKPRRSGGAYRTHRLMADDPLDFEAIEAPAMIQPYFPGVETKGEVSLIFFEGRFSHAIRKVAAKGDFRVQPDWGGEVTRAEPDELEMAAAQAALTAIEEGPLLYARVDMVRDLENRPVIMELELLEPDLYLGYEAGAQARFVEAVLARA